MFLPFLGWEELQSPKAGRGRAELGLFLTSLPQESWHHHYEHNGAGVEQGCFTLALTSV